MIQLQKYLKQYLQINEPLIMENDSDLEKPKQNNKIIIDDKVVNHLLIAKAIMLLYLPL